MTANDHNSAMPIIIRECEEKASGRDTFMFEIVPFPASWLHQRETPQVFVCKMAASVEK